MRLIVILALVFGPFVAPAPVYAANVSDEALGGHRSSCLRNCSQKHARATCVKACDCMQSEIKQHWTQETFDKYAATLKKNPKDRATSTMVQQLAAYCFQKARGN